MGTVKVSVLEQDGVELDVPTEMDLAQAIDYVSSNTTLGTSVQSHIANTNNPHSTTKAQVGLGSVPNVDATLRSNHTGTQLASTISDFSSTVLATVLTGISFVTVSAISATDTVLTALGKLQAQLNSIFASLAKVRRLTTTVTLSNSSSTTFVNISELSVDVVAGKTYLVRGMLAFTSAATTVGISWSLDGTSNGILSVQDSVPTSRTATQSYSAVAKAGIMTHTSTATNTSVEGLYFTATYLCNTSGTLYPKFRSENNGSAIVIQTSSVLECIEI